MRIIGARYALLDELASGGMATVHYGRLAAGDGFEKRVAIKRLHPQFAKDPDFVGMFLDEARLSARIQHPNVVQTLDVVRDGAELFLVMDYVHGESLSRLARAERDSGRPVPVAIALRIVLDVLAGLEAAHDAKGPTGEPLGIVHRDVSPQNVLVGADGVSRLIDFGVAKARGRMRTTPSGQVKGKLAYMAPEQITGSSVTAQADLYAVGVLFWELVTGRRLFSGDSEAQTLALSFAGKIPRASEIAAVPPAIDEIIARATARDPRRRYALAQEMSGRLEALPEIATRSDVKRWVTTLAADVLGERERRFAELEALRIEPASERPPAVALPSPLEEATRTTSVSSLAARSRPRRGLWLGVIAAAAVATVALVFALSPRSEPAPAAGPASPLPTATPSSTPIVTAPAVSAMPPAPSASSASSAKPAPAPKPRSETRSVRAPAKRARCNPPYTVDSDGIKHIKRECL